MRKCRFLIKDLTEEEILPFLDDDIFVFLEENGVESPFWSIILFIYVRRTLSGNWVVSASFFEEYEDFIDWYNRVLASFYEDFQTFSFAKKDESWIPFPPPTIIGNHLETRLRF